MYHGFPLVEATRTDGWCFGAITEFEDPLGCEAGDGFVEAADGSRAGIVWSVGSAPTQLVCEPDARRWGVYAVAFPRPIQTVEDLVRAFRTVLPELKTAHARIRRPAD